MTTALLALQWSGRHSALDPFGPQAGRVHSLWQFLWIVAALVLLAVVVTLLLATFRRRGEAPEEAGPRTRSAVATAVAGTVAVLLVFLGVNFATGRAVTLPPDDALLLRITGHQWWWEVTYPARPPGNQVTTANEIHVPVGVPVVAELQSSDVIHSFWPANLVGKRDLIPGETASIWFRADSAGVYRAQCAEFCGHGHAKMALLVIAEPHESFDAWLVRQRDSARTPADSLARRGQEVFLASSCVMCHSVRGTPAGSRIGPDLTHLASRRSLAAGSIPNTRGHLAGWILDPQRIKPGARMPANALSPPDLEALLAYLESLR
ncbi:MAG TPA: cytochrome c oxidase subunit II [Gemmatimonadales bacterium]